MLKNSASGVLASLRGSAYRSVRLASSLAAALLDGLFEHPARGSPIVLTVRTSEALACLHNSPQPPETNPSRPIMLEPSITACEPVRSCATTLDGFDIPQ